MLVRLTLKASNKKTGPIPVSTSTAATCPDACPLKAAGCYAKGGPLAIVWREVTEGKVGMLWDAFCDAISTLPVNTLWRHNQAGDLPGDNDAIDADKLAALVTANAGKRGFTYTHKPVPQSDARSVHADANLAALRRANANGFTVNLSANTIAEADRMMLTGLPVVTLLDAREGERHDIKTPGGFKIATCPATYRDDVTCKSCGLCAVQSRKVIVGFPAHGAAKKAAAKIARA